jgi:site-specific DNA-methyltransferase (adenine-specific)
MSACGLTARCIASSIYEEKKMTYTIHHGNNLDILPTLAENSVDSIVTDPPYELGFMGKKWDSSGIAYSVELWRECLRVLKPGGHLLSFGGTRTWHRVAVAIEDAGFEVRDSIAWMYGSGFPKSLDVSKAIDKAARAEREVVGTKETRIPGGNTFAQDEWTKQARQLGAVDITAPATPEAQQWEGWGTALKPAFEPIVVARKPLIGTVAENVLTYGTGGLNIDGSRIQGTKPSVPQPRLGVANGVYEFGTGEGRNGEMSDNSQGRWPANVILDEYTAELLDEQSGIIKSGKLGIRTSDGFNAKAFGKGIGIKAGQPNGQYCDIGGASRFFYCAKASKRDRNEGLEDLPVKQTTGGGGLTAAGGAYGSIKAAANNFHPTVKPTDLMRYLIKLVTPPNGIVLDPFTGSGSTGKAAILEGFEFIGIELTADYLPIIEGRLRWAERREKETTLFD